MSKISGLQTMVDSTKRQREDLKSYNFISAKRPREDRESLQGIFGIYYPYIYRLETSMRNGTTDVAVRAGLLDLSVRWIDSLEAFNDYRSEVIRVQVMCSMNGVGSPYFPPKFCDIMRMLDEIMSAHMSK
jgi:hypothetical protein